MTQLLEQTVERLQALPADEQNRIAAELQEQLDRIAPQTGRKNKRKAGLGRGRFEVPADFTAPLPDSFVRSFHRALAAGVLLLSLVPGGSAPAWAQLVASPEVLTVSLPQGGEAERVLALTNRGSAVLSFCLSFERPLQRTGRSARLSPGTLGATCGEYGEVLALIDQTDLPGCCAAPYGLTMTPNGRLFTAELNGGRTYELDAALNYVRMFEHPEVSDLEPFPATTGVTYNADTGTLWWLNIEDEVQDNEVIVLRALLLEGDLNGVATGRRIELPVAEDGPPPHANGSPVGLSYDAATQHYYYVDIANETIWAVDTLGNVIDRYPTTPEAYPGASLFWGINTLPDSTGEDIEPEIEGLRLELYINPPGPTPPKHLGVVGRFGGDTAPGGTEPLETPLLDPLPGTDGSGNIGGQAVRSTLDPNGVLYYPWSGFDGAGVVAVRPHPLPPSWLVVEAWDGTLAPGERREITLTFRPGARSLGDYTATLQAFTAATGEAVEVPLAMAVVRETAGEDDVAAPQASNLSVYPNPLGRGGATVALTLDEQSEARVVVYDLLGREVMTLHTGDLAPGEHLFGLDGTWLPSGVYLVRAEAGEHEFTEQITMVR